MHPNRCKDRPQRRLLSFRFSKSIANSSILFISSMLLLSQRSRAFVSVSLRHHVVDHRRQLFSMYAKKRIVFLGTPEVAAETLSTLFQQSKSPESEFDITAVVTQPPRRGKRRKLESSPVQRTAESLDIPVLSPEKANEKEFLDQLRDDIQPDLCITAAYGQYLPKRFLQTPKLGTVNIHPSLLPKWRGASPVQRSLEHGDNPIGVSVLYTVSKMDAGPIIAQETYECNDEENATILLPKLFHIGTSLLLDRLSGIFNGDITFDTANPQDESKATNAALIHSSEAEVQPWQDSAETILNKMRGFSMWPQTFVYMQVGDREPIKVKLLNARLDGTTTPTDLVESGPTKSSGLRLVCYDGSVLEIIQLCPATRKPCPSRDFQNGYPGETIRWVRPPVVEDASKTSSESSISKSTTATSQS